MTTAKQRVGLLTLLALIATTAFLAQPSAAAATDHGYPAYYCVPINADSSASCPCSARNLNALSELPILLWDERLSTAAAERTLLEADASRRRRAQVIDKLAAAIILQGALDRMRRITG